MHTGSVADHSRHRVQRLQNCVVRRRSRSGIAMYCWTKLLFCREYTVSRVVWKVIVQFSGPHYSRGFRFTLF